MATELVQNETQQFDIETRSVVTFSGYLIPRSDVPSKTKQEGNTWYWSRPDLIFDVLEEVCCTTPPLPTDPYLPRHP